MNRTKIDWPFEPAPLLTVNPFIGCSHASEGCDNCYAEAMARRLAAMGNEDYAVVADWTGKTLFIPHRLDALRSRRKPATVFWCSMSDLFHDNNADKDIVRVFYYLNRMKHLTHVVLTKRPERMAEFMATYRRCCGDTAIGDNVWLGVTAENQRTADERIPVLLSIPGQHKTFVSVEPMLEGIDLGPQVDADGNVYWPLGEERYVDCGGCTATASTKFSPQPKPTCHGHLVGGIDQIIIGAETGPNARPCNPEHILDLREQCAKASVPCYIKANARKLLEVAK